MNAGGEIPFNHSASGQSLSFGVGGKWVYGMYKGLPVGGGVEEDIMLDHDTRSR
jgi:hypothetical protein